MKATNAAANPTRKYPFFIHRTFALLWFGQSISTFGDFIFGTTLTLWIALTITRGQSWAPLAVSGEFIAMSIPVLFFAPIAGVFADRWNKRRTMMYMDAARAFLIALLLVLPLFGHLLISFLQLAIIYFVVLATTTCSQLFNPSRFTLISEVVDEPQRTHASSLSQTTWNLARLLGPALAAPLFFIVGISWALIIDVLSFLISFLCILTVHLPEAQKENSVAQLPNFWRELGEGLRFCVQNRLIRMLLTCFLILSLGIGALETLSVFFVTLNLHASPSVYGLVSPTIAVGTLVGALLATFWSTRLDSARSFWLSLFAISILLIILTRQTTIMPALILYFLLGVPLALFNTTIVPLMMHIIPHDLLGRVSSIINPAESLGGILSAIIAGWLASTILHNFRITILALSFSTYDTIFAFSGFMFFIGAIYAMLSLRTIHLNKREITAE